MAHRVPGQALFGIVQGGMYSDLRRKSIEALAEIAFEGYAIGGLSVGESKERMFQVVAEAARTLRPEMVADFANELASRFNLFYDNVPVLKAEGAGVKEARLRLVEATKTVISNALTLIGIEAPSRM
jgi:hypothetical protein